VGALPPEPLRPFRLSVFAAANTRPGRSAAADFVASLLYAALPPGPAVRLAAQSHLSGFF